VSDTPTPTTVTVELPRADLGEELAAALGTHGLEAKLVEDGGRYALRVRYASDERERLAAETTHAIESWLGEHESDLVVQRANGRCVVRPPGD
jgi:hypothetical protein